MVLVIGSESWMHHLKTAMGINLRILVGDRGSFDLIFFDLVSPIVSVLSIIAMVFELSLSHKVKRSYY